MPAQHQAILQLLDRYRQGQVSPQAIMAIDPQQLVDARAWLREWTNRRMDEAFPELDALDEC